MSLNAAFVVPHPPVILPEIGHGREQEISATITAYRAAMQKAAELKPQTVVIISPHSVMYQDYFHISPGDQARGNFGRFGASQVRVAAAYDTEFADALEKNCNEEKLPGGTLGERDAALDHGTMIPLHFFNEFAAADYRLVRIGLAGLSPLDHYELGQLIAKTAADLGRSTVVIASGDLSHKLTADGPYGFAAQGPKFDALTMDALDKGDFLTLLKMDPALSEGAAECGLRSFWIMAGALDGKAVESKALSYEGPFGVGYGVASFIINGDDESRDFGRQLKDGAKQDRNGEDPLVGLARLSLETYVKTGNYAPLPLELPKELTTRKAGAFVSLKKYGQLRGCIGTITPSRDSLAEEILHNAVSAGTGDPRFPSVKENELEDLVYSVDVLGEPEAINGVDALDPKTYGVIVEQGRRRGLLLPDLAGVDSVEQQIEIACQKAGIDSDRSDDLGGSGEPLKLYRFQVVRHQ
ncbi:MAG TPA: AmmeMemoRadiSam system protein A [Clostridiales bacterium]|nr:AmmeMemoRadiSam system protein A [Clostridiales bacterium]